MNGERNSKNKKWIIYLTVTVIVVIVFICWSIWVNSRLNRIEEVAKDINKINEDFFNDIQKIDTLGSQFLFSMQVLSKEDIQSIKKILFALKTEVDKAIEFSHQDTINIVDRVNLYVTIGVVLLTLLGVFVPVIVQNFGREEMKEKIKETEKKISDGIKNMDGKLINMDTKISDGEKEMKEKICTAEEDMKKRISDGIRDMEKKSREGIENITNLVATSEEEINKSTSEKLAKLKREIDDSKEAIKPLKHEVRNIPPMRLSYSLLRALDKDLIRWYSKNPNDNRAHLGDIFAGISSDLQECKNIGILPGNNDTLKKSLRDFNFHLRDILITFQGGRNHLDPFKSLQSWVDKLVNNGSHGAEESLFDNVINEVENIRNSLLPPNDSLNTE